ncbi:G-protein coupled receptor 4-like [Microcaecilia unicolor]|uniref:G-protein coupled receptor 4-like n=1 Tax=Microcaecilia unicolor TaxID=1415580 RepID=A0A6P7WN88_9AMPH|nr:G-protein coupled receptor 4-like [Microcaecilia unicolor]
MFVTSFYSIIFILALPLNCLVLWAMAPQLKTEQCLPVYAMNLLASNLLLLAALPFSLAYVLQNYHWTLGAAACTLVHAVFFLHLFVSVLFLTWIAVMRYVAVGHPLRFSALQTTRCSYLSSAALWLVAIALSSTGAFMLPSHGQTNSNRSSCFETYPVPRDYALFHLVVSILFYFLPCLILGIMYLLIQRTLRGSSSVQAVERKRITTLLAFIVMYFAVLFGPCHVIWSYRCIVVLLGGDTCSVEKTLSLPGQVTLAVSNLSALLVPVFYMASFKSIWQRIRCHTAGT